MATRTSVLDVRTLPQGEKHPRAVATFDALKPGEAFVLVSDHEPRGLLLELQTKRPRAFEWNVIENGREVFRVEIERRESTAPRNVSDLLGRDHDRLDGLFWRATHLAKTGDYPAARASFHEFSHGLIQHIKAEENVLFPAFEDATGMTSGPTVVMRAEHREIGRLLEQAQTALAGNDGASFANLLAELGMVLAAHNQKEERILYPMTDRCLESDEEREELARAIQAQSSGGSCGCCSTTARFESQGLRLPLLK
jgi:uncharacterized protein (DUF2249 family)/hemerythrin superfamily protein